MRTSRAASCCLEMSSAAAIAASCWRSSTSCAFSNVTDAAWLELSVFSEASSWRFTARSFASVLAEILSFASLVSSSDSMVVSRAICIVSRSSACCRPLRATERKAWPSTNTSSTKMITSSSVESAST